MIQKPYVLVVPLLLALLPSCLMRRDTVNEPIEESGVSQLEPGMSAQEVTALLGAPAQVVELDKRSAWRYEFRKTKTAALFLLVVSFYNSDTRADRVWCFFDENDVLTHMGQTLEAADAEWAMPWSAE